MNNDDDVVALLRSAAQELPGTRPEHLVEATGAGRQLRRRRRAATVLGGGTTGLALIVGLVALNAGTGNGSQTVMTPAAAPSPAPASSKQAKAAPAGTQADRAKDERANQAVLLEALGPDWQGLADTAVAEPRPGSDAAKALPDGYSSRATMMVFNTDGTPELSLAEVCKPFAEKGTVNQGCTPLKAPDGTTVYYAGPGPADADEGGGPWSSAMYYFGRPDGSLVRIEFTAGTSAERVSAAQQQRAVDWMAGYQQALAGAVSDDGVMPEPTADGSPQTAPTITGHDRDLMRMQRALGTSWTLYDGKLALEPNWGEYKQLPTLPHGYWDSPADITSISKSAFDAACGAKAGAAACEKVSAPDGSDVYLRSWADRDATTGEYVGESAAYLLREDGSVLLADVELRSVQETKVRNADQVAGMRTWLHNLQARLIKAVTDPDMKG